MRPTVSSDDLMRFLDGELPSDEMARVEEALKRSTELQREFRIFQALRDDVSGLTYDPPARESVWDGVERRLTRPLGWILFVFGAILWTAWGAWVFATSATNPNGRPSRRRSATRTGCQRGSRKSPECASSTAAGATSPTSDSTIPLRSHSSTGRRSRQARGSACPLQTSPIRQRSSTAAPSGRKTTPVSTRRTSVS